MTTRTATIDDFGDMEAFVETSQIDGSESLSFIDFVLTGLKLNSDFSSVYPELYQIDTQSTETGDRNAFLLQKISECLDIITSNKKYMKEVNKKELLEQISEVLINLPVERKKQITRSSLKKIVEKMIALDLLINFTSDFTEKEIKDFKKASERRSLFK